MENSDVFLAMNENMEEINGVKQPEQKFFYDSQEQYLYECRLIGIAITIATVIIIGFFTLAWVLMP